MRSGGGVWTIIFSLCMGVLAFWWPTIEKQLFSGCPWPISMLHKMSSPTTTDTEKTENWPTFTLEELKK